MSDFPIHRDNLPIWLNDRGLTGTMVEIGCAFGGFTESVLGRWKGSAYYMIDPWANQDKEVYRETQEEGWKYQAWFDQCSGIAERDKRVKLFRMLSHDAAPLIPDDSLDCCYIDGNHSLKAVTEDLNDWFPKVKSGGLFCGHDFGNQTADQVPGWDCEVQRAIEAFIKERKLNHPAVTLCSSWWMIKP